MKKKIFSKLILMSFGFTLSSHAESEPKVIAPVITTIDIDFNEPGATPDKAFTLKPIKGVINAEQAAREYITTNYLNYTLEGFLYTMDKGRHILSIGLLDENQKNKIVYFNLDTYYEAVKKWKLSKAQKAELKKVMDWHLPKKAKLAPDSK